MDELEERVCKFNSLSLPGQPMGMHMGTSYLVNELWREIKRLRGLTPRAGDGAESVCPECGAKLNYCTACEKRVTPRA